MKYLEKKRETNQCSIIAFHLTKGGVGKTTTLINFGHCLMKKDYKILFVDCDPQSSLSKFYGIYKKAEKRISNLLNNKEKIKPFEMTEKLHFIVGDKGTHNINVPIPTLKEMLEEYRNEYDYILIDTSPAISRMTLNAMYACDFIFIPVEATMEGMESIEDTIEAFEVNDLSKIGGLFITKYRKGGMTSEQIKTALNGKILKTYIRDSIQAPNARLIGKPVIDMYNSMLSIDYHNLTDEILEIVNKNEYEK